MIQTTLNKLQTLLEKRNDTAALRLLDDLDCQIDALQNDLQEKGNIISGYEQRDLEQAARDGWREYCRR